MKCMMTYEYGSGSRKIRCFLSGETISKASVIHSPEPQHHELMWLSDSSSLILTLEAALVTSSASHNITATAWVITKFFHSAIKYHIF